MRASGVRLPDGVVAFMFTDIEGSTRLLRDLGERYVDVLGEHHGLMRDALRAHNGVEVRTEGDSFFVAFSDAADAVRAAVAAQTALEHHAWPHDARVRVRMGIHSGPTQVVANDYVGLAVHEAARISAAAHGGQILVSDTVEEALRDIPGAPRPLDLGLHKLKDFAEPRRLWQIPHGGDDRARGVRAGGAAEHDLPLPASALLGREDDVARAVHALDSGADLVTLTGPGGVGKTRLAVEIAHRVLGRFPGGAWFVPLDSITDADGVPALIAERLRVRLQPGADAIEAARSHLGSQPTLLVLDNFEHVLPASAGVVRLRGAPLSILVTSREPLRLRDERVQEVEPLTVRSRTVQHAPAVELFIERARGAGATFDWDEDAVGYAARICERLDGLPLAIELAAARTDLLSPQQLLAKLDAALDLLSSGPRDAAARHRDLRATIAWSYELLDQRERDALATISVFPGGGSLDAIEAVAGGPVIDRLATLIEKGLVRRTVEDGELRFSSLETIKQYVWERAPEEVQRARMAHAGRFLAFVETADAGMLTAELARWAEMIERELANVRAALEFFLADPESMTRLVVALVRFWSLRGHWNEARVWFDRVLALDAVDPKSRALVGMAAGLMAAYQGDHDLATLLMSAAVADARRAEDPATVAQALAMSANAALVRSAMEDVSADLGEATTAARASGDPRVLATCLITWSMYHLYGARWDDARSALTETLAAAERAGDRRTVASALNNLGLVMREQGDLAGAQRSFEGALDVFRELGNRDGVGAALDNLAVLAERNGDLQRARLLREESFELFRQLGLKLHMARSNDQLIELVRDDADLRRSLLERAVRLWEEAGYSAQANSAAERLAALRAGAPS